MKKLLFLLLISSQVLFAQDRDPRTDQFNFVPGQLIVQLKEHIDAEITYKSSGVGTTQKDIGTLLGIGDKVSKAKVLFSEKTVLKSISMKNALVKDPRLPEPHSLKNTFVIELNDKQENILALVEELKGNPDVEYAEPNYYYSVNDFTIDSEIITEDELNEPSTKRTAADPNDALYSQQLNIPATNIDKVWNTYTTGDGSQTIAILDTGIDYEHPDLVDNIWINQAELNGIEGFDDDNNGYIDDIKGWDFINLDNAPLDDNMHGTHVAGIAGAVGDNAIGIAGAAWNVKLIPIKVFQASGIGDLATIAQGIDYAVNNEATVLNMSFGGVASITLKNALANAYATSFLVAAAGNNGMPLPPCIPSLIFYPAAYTFVLGVESNGGFSNYDCDGPIFSTLIEQQNYETKALGVSILSTVPNGGYRNLSGTSMAAPLVSGFMALYKQIKQEDSNERIFGNIINTKTGEYIDALAAIVAEPSPILKILTAQAIDTISGNVYQDGQLDSGEEIHLYPKIKNYWGQADSVKVVLKLGGNEVQNEFYRSIITLTDSIIDIGSISDYAIYNQYENPLKFKISNDVAHNTQIEFRMIAWDEIQENTKKDSLVFKLKIKNAVKLQGLIEKDTILYPDTEYILTNPLILNNASLILKPGVTLRFGADELTQQSGRITFLNQSNIVALGTKDSLITFKPDTYSSGFRIDFGNGYSYLDYCVIDNGQFVYPGETTNSQFINGGGQYGGIMKKSNMIQPTYVMYGSWEHVNIVDANANNQQTNGLRYYTPLKNNVLGMYAAQYDYIGNYYSYDLTGYYLGSNYITEFENIYLGTGSVDILKELNTDAFDGGTGVFKYNNPRLVPYSEAHGIVWKVEVNGLNALDEYDQMDPIGVGNHEFKVYFNRAADTFYTPNIAYGVREPWNSKMITEIGSWSEDSTIYSVIHDVKIGAADGINRIRVTDARDVEGFEVPVEQRRFNILIQSAGSASAGFMATPGLGEITLEWEAPDETLLEDVLGYNMYRYDAITDSTFTDTIKLNTVLISDAQFIDYQVEEGKRYYYQYKILRTSFDETDFSKTVAAEPLTSMLGDGNGDFEVNVMDLVHSVDYILGNNPTPFIFRAADVNADTYINVLDIVGTVDIILNPGTKRIATVNQKIEFISNTPVGEALFYWEGDDLYVESKESIAGLQLAFEKDFSYTLSESTTGFEWLNYTQDNQKILMMYSFDGFYFTAGKTKLLSRASSLEAELDITKAVVGTPKGFKLTPIFKNSGELLDIEAPIQSDQAELITVAPNPSRGIFNIEYYIPEQMDKVLIQVYSLKGEQLWAEDKFKNTSGQASATLNLSHLNDGIYLIVMDVLRSGEIKKREVKKLIISKN